MSFSYATYDTADKPSVNTVTAGGTPTSYYANPTFLGGSVTSVHLGNGTGQYFLDPQSQYAVNPAGDLLYQNQSTELLNQETNELQADVIVALDNLQATYPTLHHLHIPIAWFANDLRCSILAIKPGWDNNVAVQPSPWSVHGLVFSDVAQISTNTNQGALAYYGTPSDSSLVRLCSELKRRGLTVTFVPIILLDIPINNTRSNPYSNNSAQLGQPAYPDRGYITISPASGYTGSGIGTTNTNTQINGFLGTVTPENIAISLDNVGNVEIDYTGPDNEWSYRRFILHYTQLLATINAAIPNVVQGIIIGSRLSGLTSVYNNVNQAPMVTGLINLAADVRNVLPNPIEISYAASQFEWNGIVLPNNAYLFHMDPLWTDENINYIGLSWYAHLSDWQNNPGELDSKITNGITAQYIAANIESGEYYFWSYANGVARVAQTRTPIEDPMYPTYSKNWMFRGKDLRSWWINLHYNRANNGIQLHTPTAWTPALKSFRFVDIGCPAIDKGTNQPYQNSDAGVITSLDFSTLPYFSSGNPDSVLQMTALSTFIDYWTSNNQYGVGQYGVGLIDISMFSIHYWDPRPNPFYPALVNFWQDTYNYATGYAINGKEGLITNQIFNLIVDYTKLLTSAFDYNPLWVALMEAVSQTMNPLIQDAINRLKLIRDPDSSETYIKALNLRMMGFKVPVQGLSDAEYDRLVRYIGSFYQTSGASYQFVNFLSFVRQSVFYFTPLYLTDLNYNNLQPSQYVINGEVIKNQELDLFYSNTGGDWSLTGGSTSPSPYFEIQYDILADPTLDEGLYLNLFTVLQPLHLVNLGLVGFLNVITNSYVSAQILDQSEVTVSTIQYTSPGGGSSYMFPTVETGNSNDRVFLTYEAIVSVIENSSIVDKSKNLLKIAKTTIFEQGNILDSNTNLLSTPTSTNTVAPLTLAMRGNVLPTTVNEATSFWAIYSGGVGPYTFAFANGTIDQQVGSSGSYIQLFDNGDVGVFAVGNAAPIASESDIVTLVITDATGNTASATYTQTYTANDCIVLSTDFFLTNKPTGSSNAIVITPYLPDYTSAATCTYTEPSGLLTVQWQGVNGGYIFVSNSNWPPAGAYPITFTIAQGSKNNTFTRTIYIADNNGPAFIQFTPAPVFSTSLPAGFIIGQANAGGDADNTYTWSVGGSSAQYFVVSSTGQVTLISAPTTAGSYPLILVCGDNDASYSQTFTLDFVAGNTLPSSNMTAAIPSNLTNAISSGVLTTPNVAGFTPNQWLLTGQCGVGTRYQNNIATGEIDIIGALSYQVAANGRDFLDVLTLSATDGINTCSKTFTVPVAQVVGPTINIGPADILQAAGVTGTSYATISAYQAAVGVNEPGNTGSAVPGTVLVLYSPPQTDSRYKTYFKDDGQNYDHGVGAGGLLTVFMPLTIMGAPGRTFPYMTATVGQLAKGLFGAENFDLTLKNLTVANATNGNGYGNIGGIYKEAGCTTGNLIVDNVYIHDCDDGIARGCPGSKVLMTNTRISHCGIGSAGLTHNIYVECDVFYAANCLTDQAFNGHLFKTRSQSTIIENLRIFDGQLGCASEEIDMPHGGLSSVTNTLLHKGPNGQNPFMMKFADPNDQNIGLQGKHNVLMLNSNTFLLDPGQPGQGNIMPGMNTSNAAQAEVTAVVNGSFPGSADGLPAIITAAGNSFFGVLSGQEIVVQNYVAGSANIPPGTNTVTGSTTLAASARPVLNFAFPGPGPDPTVNDPPGPFLNSWLGGVGGGQFIAPINIMKLAIGAPAGTNVGTVVWLQGNTSIATPIFAINYQSGPNAFTIDQSGNLTTTATAVAQTTQADIIGVTASGGGQEYIWNFTVATYQSTNLTSSVVESGNSIDNTRITLKTTSISVVETGNIIDTNSTVLTAPSVNTTTYLPSMLIHLDPSATTTTTKPTGPVAAPYSTPSPLIQIDSNNNVQNMVESNYGMYIAGNGVCQLVTDSTISKPFFSNPNGNAAALEIPNCVGDVMCGNTAQPFCMSMVVRTTNLSMPANVGDVQGNNLIGFFYADQNYIHVSAQCYYNGTQGIQFGQRDSSQGNYNGICGTGGNPCNTPPSGTGGDTAENGSITVNSWDICFYIYDGNNYYWIRNGKVTKSPAWTNGGGGFGGVNGGLDSNGHYNNVGAVGFNNPLLTQTTIKVLDGYCGDLAHLTMHDQAPSDTQLNEEAARLKSLLGITTNQITINRGITTVAAAATPTILDTTATFITKPCWPIHNYTAYPKIGATAPYPGITMQSGATELFSFVFGSDNANCNIPDGQTYRDYFYTNYFVGGLNGGAFDYINCSGQGSPGEFLGVSRRFALGDPNDTSVVKSDGLHLMVIPSHPATPNTRGACLQAGLMWSSIARLAFPFNPGQSVSIKYQQGSSAFNWTPVWLYSGCQFPPLIGNKDAYSGYVHSPTELSSGQGQWNYEWDLDDGYSDDLGNTPAGQQLTFYCPDIYGVPRNTNPYLVYPTSPNYTYKNTSYTFSAAFNPNFGPAYTRLPNSANWSTQVHTLTFNWRGDGSNLLDIFLDGNLLQTRYNEYNPPSLTLPSGQTILEPMHLLIGNQFDASFDNGTPTANDAANSTIIVKQITAFQGNVANPNSYQL